MNKSVKNGDTLQMVRNLHSRKSYKIGTTITNFQKPIFISRIFHHNNHIYYFLVSKILPIWQDFLLCRLQTFEACFITLRMSRFSHFLFLNQNKYSVSSEMLQNQRMKHSQRLQVLDFQSQFFGSKISLILPKLIFLHEEIPQTTFC